MHFEMKMPDLATTDSAIRVVRWFIEPGQKIERGRPLMEIETDKAAMVVESVVTGILDEVKVEIDEEVSVGQVIASFEVEDAPARAVTSLPPLEPRGKSLEITQPPLASAAQQEPCLAGKKVDSSADRPKGMFARNRGAAASRSTEKQEISLSIAHRTAAKRLQESKQTVPHFYLQTSFNAGAIIAKRNAAGSVKPAWDAFFVRAVARAIVKFDRFGFRFEGERLVKIEGDSIGVAIDHEGELYVIPIASPAAKPIEQISEAIRQGVAGLRNGDPEMRKIQPALMTVTNLGVCNVESFIPIISPPEAAILGIGKVLSMPVALANGQIGVEPRATITLSVDHRVLSGRYAAEFLGEIVRELETN